MESLNCPNCGSQMVRDEEEDIAVERCGKCGGIFLDHGELNVLATGMGGDIEYCSIDHEKHADRFPTRTCPRCGDREMQKVNLLSYSNLVFDYCPQCKGFYLDQGELARANVELAAITPRHQPQEYRGHRDGHLVRLDRIMQPAAAPDFGAGDIGPSLDDVPDVYILRLSVYFKEPLGLGLRVSSETWTHKILRWIGLSRRGEVRTETPLDRSFVVTGEEAEKIRTVFSNEPVTRQLLEFASNKPRMLIMDARLEITDHRVLLTEGPYNGDRTYDAESDPFGIVKRTFGLAVAIEQAAGG